METYIWKCINIEHDWKMWTLLPAVQRNKVKRKHVSTIVYDTSLHKNIIQESTFKQPEKTLFAKKTPFICALYIRIKYQNAINKCLDSFRERQTDALMRFKTWPTVEIKETSRCFPRRLAGFLAFPFPFNGMFGKLLENIHAFSGLYLGRLSCQVEWLEKETGSEVLLFQDHTIIHNKQTIIGWELVPVI